MDKKILVTGGSGLIGSYLKNFIPTAIYVSSKEYNLLNLNEVEEMFKKIKPKIVIHLAAVVGGIHHNIKEPVKYFEENILMNTFVLRESFKSKVENFTGIFYGGPWKFLGNQLYGMVVYSAWTLVLSGLMFYGLKIAGWFRVTEEDEDMGVDKSHHGGSAYNFDKEYVPTVADSDAESDEIAAKEHIPSIYEEKAKD